MSSTQQYAKIAACAGAVALRVLGCVRVSDTGRVGWLGRRWSGRRRKVRRFQWWGVRLLRAGRGGVLLG